MATFSSANSPPQTTVPAELLRRIRAEYLEMPGLCLSAPQAQRLWGPDCAPCEAALVVLVEAQFLARTPTGLFVLAATPRANRKVRSLQSERVAHVSATEADAGCRAMA